MRTPHQRFLSTLSLRRATGIRSKKLQRNHSISIHALLAESDFLAILAYLILSIFLSTLSLRRATQNPGKHYVAFRFLSTLSLRRATVKPFKIGKNLTISIHALLAESDLNQIPPRRFHYHFYPRSPCGERPKNGGLSAFIFYFYPRSPCGERLGISVHTTKGIKISIHALLAESDPHIFGGVCQSWRISIHALLAESDTLTA